MVQGKEWRTTAGDFNCWKYLPANRYSGLVDRGETVVADLVTVDTCKNSWRISCLRGKFIVDYLADKKKYHDLSPVISDNKY
jgi:hypothetical protein